MLSCGSKWCLWGHVGHTMFSSATPMVDCCSSSNIKHPGKFFLDAMVEPWPTGRSLEDIIHPLDLPKGHDKACMTSCRPDHRYVDSASIRFGINIPWYFFRLLAEAHAHHCFNPLTSCFWTLQSHPPHILRAPSTLVFVNQAALTSSTT